MVQEYSVIDDMLSGLNDDERFYRAYFEAARKPDTLKQFLHAVGLLCLLNDEAFSAERRC